MSTSIPSTHHHLRPAEAQEEPATEHPFPNEARYYTGIVIVLFTSFIITGTALLLLYVKAFKNAIGQVFDARALLAIELYFWAALGATVASYKFFANDKDANEIESIKKRPSPKILRYPNSLDVVLYVQRVLFRGVLGVIGGIIMMAGLGYFDVQLSAISDKQRMFFIVFAFLIGVYQNEFLAFLTALNKKILLRMESAKNSEEGEPAKPGRSSLRDTPLRARPAARRHGVYRLTALKRNRRSRAFRDPSRYSVQGEDCGPCQNRPT